MFSKELQALVDVISRANDQFSARNPEASTVVGVTNQSLRALGDDSDTVSIGCNHTGQRLMFIMKDSIPGRIGIGIGIPKTEELEFLGESERSDVDEAHVLALMEKHLATGPLS